MDKFIVTGEVQLKGDIRVSGAKNAALPIMAATTLCSGTSIIHDAPDLSDIRNMVAILQHLGAKVSREGKALIIDSSALDKAFIPEFLMREMRASIFLMGALVGRFKEVRLSYPGGCSIGPRPIDLHIKALEKLGANVKEKHGVIIAEAKKLSGAEIVLDFPSVGATENAMMSAVLANGKTILRNVAREPEIIDLETFLNKMGAKIYGAGTDTIFINGVQNLHATEHTVMPDRIEAGTFVLAGAMSHGEVTVTNISSNYLFSLLDKLSSIGADLTFGNDFIRVKANQLYNTDIKTLPFPGFPTDLQAPMLSLLTMAKGTSIVTETIFENRFQHVDQLIRMGAKIRVEGRSAIVRGVKKLTGTIVEALDLRAGASLVLAALAAEGTSIIKQVNHIDRGYEMIEQKLQSLGAYIIRDME